MDRMFRPRMCASVVHTDMAVVRCRGRMRHKDGMLVKVEEQVDKMVENLSEEPGEHS